MKSLVFMLLLINFAAVIVAEGEGEYCYSDVKEKCATEGNTKKDVTDSNLPDCTASYGGIKNIESDLQKYANQHIFHSFHHLIMASYYGNYINNRPGFEKLFKGLSDSLWEDAIDLIKYITKRGGEMNFSVLPDGLKKTKDVLENHELGSIANALDFEKELATSGFKIHEEATRPKHYDPEVSSHIEQTFMHKQRDIIRKLSGYITDLNSFRGPDHSISLYLFDEYLQNQ